MKTFYKKLEKYEQLLFLDLEGTQESHELIALSAILATLNEDKTIKELAHPFNIYVRPHHRIGNYVKKLTGITEELLKEKGISYPNALIELVNYVGGEEVFSQLAFVTFGNHDLRIFNQSLRHSPDADRSIVERIGKNFFDLSAVISGFVKDGKGNPLSLANYCECFEIPFTGTAHNPYYDALNLAYLYDAFLKRSDIILREYKNLLAKSSKLPTPIRTVVHNLLKGKTVTPEDFDYEIRQAITPLKEKK
ncbi:MAG: 3'-5' exonuclease [Bacilli bacterium]|jgi:inhibitor of KinA sporulation pathway (predicted exonuclease)